MWAGDAAFHQLPRQSHQTYTCDSREQRASSSFPAWHMQLTDAAPARVSQTCALLLRRQKYLKERIAAGADHFNRDAKKGVQFLTTVSLLPPQPERSAMASFLRHASGLDKTAVGDYLGEKDAFAVGVLDQFAILFDFGVRFCYPAGRPAERPGNAWRRVCGRVVNTSESAAQSSLV